MKKFALVLVFILGFFIVFAISGVVTFMVTLDKKAPVEDPTEAVYTGGAPLSGSDVLEDDTAVTRVTPSLRVEDAIIVRGAYGENKTAETESYEMPEVSVNDYEEDALEAAALDVEEDVKTEEKNPEVKTETKAETKAETKSEQKVEAKAEEPKKEEVKKEEVKKEEVKTETPKVEEPKVEEPRVEEPKVEEPKVEEKPQLNPNIQTSDSGL